MSLEKIILQILKEENLAGGANSAFGSGVEETSSQFSGDTYARGRADIPKSLFKSVQIRPDLKKNKRKNKRKK